MQTARLPTGLLAAVGLSATPALYASSDEASESRIAVAIGRGEPFKAPWAIDGVSLIDPTVADVEVLSPELLLVTGRAAGVTDLLFWNSDSTRMPAGMHSFYLRNMYQENRLVESGGITLSGVPIDLGKISIPTYIVGTKEDHIAPWKSVYRATGIYKGKKRFVLGASGHIAGVTNAPPNAKYGHWVNDDLPEDPDAWLAGAEAKKESWWVDWKGWIAKHAGKKVAARKPGDGKLKPLAPAPGTYVAQTEE